MKKVKFLIVILCILMLMAPLQSIQAVEIATNESFIEEGWKFVTNESLPEYLKFIKWPYNYNGYRIIEKKVDGTIVYNVLSPDGRIILPENQTSIVKIRMFDSEIHVYPNRYIKGDKIAWLPGIIVYDLNGNEMTRNNACCDASESTDGGWRRITIGTINSYVDANWKQAPWWTSGVGMSASDKFSEGYLAVRSLIRSFFVDTSGNILYLDRDYFTTQDYKNGLAEVGYSDIGLDGSTIVRIGLIDLNGNEVLPVRYDYDSIQYDEKRDLIITIEGYKDPEFKYIGNNKFVGDKAYVEDMKNAGDVINYLSTFQSVDGYCPYKKFWRYENGVLKDVTSLYNIPPKEPEPFIPDEGDDLTITDIEIEKLDYDFYITFKIFDNKLKKMITNEAVYYQIDYLINDNTTWSYTSEWDKGMSTPEPINFGGNLPNPEGLCFTYAKISKLSPNTDIKNLKIRIRIWRERKNEYGGYETYFSDWSEIAEYTATPKVEDDGKRDVEGFRIDPSIGDLETICLTTYPLTQSGPFLKILLINKDGNTDYDKSVSILREILSQKLDSKTVNDIISYANQKNDEKTKLDIKAFVSNGYCIDVQADITPYIYLEFFKGEYGNIIPMDLTPVEAVPTSSTVIINNKVVPFCAYTIKGYNYFKLRDLAMALRDTPRKFDVWYSTIEKSIFIMREKQYTVAGGELSIPSQMKTQKAIQCYSPIYISSLYKGFLAYGINGYNYVKLRDLARHLDFYVGWDGKNNTITIDTSKSYEE